MILKALLTLSALLVFSGCSWCQKIVYKDKIVKVNVPVKCVIPKPKIPCELSGGNMTRAEVIAELARCYYDLKERAKVCQ